MLLERINGIDDVGARRAVDISPGIGEVTSLNDIIKESTAESTAGITTQWQGVRKIASTGNLANPLVLGELQKSLLLYNNTVAFIGTAARKVVGTVETLLRS